MTHTTPTPAALDALTATITSRPTLAALCDEMIRTGWEPSLYTRPGTSRDVLDDNAARTALADAIDAEMRRRGSPLRAWRGSRVGRAA